MVFTTFLREMRKNKHKINKVKLYTFEIADVALTAWLH